LSALVFVAAAGIIVLLTMVGLDVRKIDRRLADIERRLSAKGGDNRLPTASVIAGRPGSTA
jgi:hypothetical protein